MPTAAAMDNTAVNARLPSRARSDSPAGIATVPGMDLLGCGREADVYALGAGRVLRRYRRGEDATGEAELMAYLKDLDFPVPEVFEARGADLIMERIEGPTMAEAFAAGDIGPADAPPIAGRQAWEEALAIRRADPALGKREAARLEATVTPVIKAALRAAPLADQPMVTTRAQDGGRSGS